MDRPEPDAFLTAGTPAAPGETAAPSEPAAPGETAAPSESAAPSENTAPSETAAPGETAVPGEIAGPSEPTAPGETATRDETAAAPVQRLDPSVVNLWRLTGALWAAFWTLAAVGAAALLEWPLWLAVPVAAASIAWTVWMPAAAYRHYAYQVGQVDVRVMHGWWTRGVTVVLHSRIQHVDTRQGPIERSMGLATVVIFTAGSVGAMVAIPGLNDAVAEALRDRLAQLSGADDAV